MIYKHSNSIASSKDDITCKVMEEVDKLIDNTGLTISENIKEIAEAVGYFVELDAAGFYTSSKDLLLYLGKALKYLGDINSSNAIALLGSGVVSSANWTFSCNTPVWVLDLKLLALKEDQFLELIFYNLMNSIINSISCVWDNTNGNGVFAIKNIKYFISKLYGTTDLFEYGVYADEIKSELVGRLKKQQEKRNWAISPHLVFLDM